MRKTPRVIGTAAPGVRRGEHRIRAHVGRGGRVFLSGNRRLVNPLGITLPEITDTAKDALLGGAGALVAGVAAEYLVSKDKFPRAYNLAHAAVGILGGALIARYVPNQQVARAGKLMAIGSATIAGFNLINDFAGDQIVKLKPSGGGFLDKYLGDATVAPSVPATTTTPASGLGSTLTAEQARAKLQTPGSGIRAIGRTMPGNTEQRVASSVAAAVRETAARMGNRFQARV